jgi:hypothetical protein
MRSYRLSACFWLNLGGGVKYGLGSRTLRSVLNFANAKYKTGKGLSILPDNPVKWISQTRSWYRIERRTEYLKPHQLLVWFDSVPLSEII